MKRISPKKRWPGMYSITAIINTPLGSTVEIETDLTEEEGRYIIKMLGDKVAEVPNGNRDPGTRQEWS